MKNSTLVKAAKELGCEFSNENSLDLNPITRKQARDWLVNNGFVESAVRQGRWLKRGVELIFDEMSGFLYVPSI